MTRTIGPFVGGPYAGDPGRCAYSLKPSDPQCPSPGAVHILAETDEWGLVAVVSCDQHRELARVIGKQHGEHPYTDLCGDGKWYLAPDGEQRCSP